LEGKTDIEGVDRMNKKGFIFTMDATLSLIPIFILLVSTTSIAPSASFGTIRQMKMTQFAQDSMLVLTDKKTNTTSAVESYLTSESNTLINNFLHNTSTQWNYKLIMNTSSGETYITGKANSSYTESDVTSSFTVANNIVVASGFATNGSQNVMYLFKMYVWEE